MTLGNVTCCIGGDMAKKLGKKGTESDLTLYNVKVEDTVLSFVEPTSYPDKIQSLVSALNMADQVLLTVDALTPELAETIVALDSQRIKKGYVIVPDDIANVASKAFAGTVVEGYEPVSPQIAELRETLASLKLDPTGDTLVQIDHAFTVKGVGTVALGTVKAGIVKKYDTLNASPQGGKATVKSIQVHDQDSQEATTGVRVGLCLKDVKPEDIPRGTILSKAELEPLMSISGQLSVSKFHKKPVAVGDQFLVNAWMGYVAAQIIEGEVAPSSNQDVTIGLDKPLPSASARAVLLDPGLKPPRVFAGIDL